MRKPSFLHSAKPVGCDNLVPRFGDRGELPEFLPVQRLCVLSSLQEDVFHCSEVVLQTVIDAGQKARAQSYLQHFAFEFDFVPVLETAGALEHLYRRPVAVDFDDLGQELGAAQVDVAEFILRNRAVCLYRYKVGNDADNLSCTFHIVVFCIIQSILRL